MYKHLDCQYVLPDEFRIYWWTFSPSIITLIDIKLGFFHFVISFILTGIVLIRYLPPPSLNIITIFFHFLYSISYNSLPSLFFQMVKFFQICQWEFLYVALVSFWHSSLLSWHEVSFCFLWLWHGIWHFFKDDLFILFIQELFNNSFKMSLDKTF